MHDRPLANRPGDQGVGSGKRQRIDPPNFLQPFGRGAVVSDELDEDTVEAEY
jgi:hypothetical protein